MDDENVKVHKSENIISMSAYISYVTSAAKSKAIEKTHTAATLDKLYPMNISES